MTIDKETHEVYVSPEIAKMLGQAGFDWKCTHEYVEYTDGDDHEIRLVDAQTRIDWGGKENEWNKYYPAPTHDVARRWLRKTFNLNIDIESFVGHYQYVCCYMPDKEEAHRAKVENEFIEVFIDDGRKDTYEEAEEAGLLILLAKVLEGGEIPFRCKLNQ